MMRYDRFGENISPILTALVEIFSYIIFHIIVDLKLFHLCTVIIWCLISVPYRVLF